MVFHLNNSKNIVQSLSAILLPPLFSGKGQFLGASFEVFGRKFGYLATVFIR
jgi:hypothetical protein